MFLFCSVPTGVMRIGARLTSLALDKGDKARLAASHSSRLVRLVNGYREQLPNQRPPLLYRLQIASAINCTIALPSEVASTGPAITVQPVASAVI